MNNNSKEPLPVLHIKALEKIKELSGRIPLNKFCICFDDDGVLHKWQNLKIDIPEYMTDMEASEKAAYIRDEVYKKLLSPGYYRNLPAQDEMVELARELYRLGFEVMVLSCSINADTSRQKMASLSECMPWLPADHIILLPDGKGKKKYDYLPEAVAGQCIPILIDDHTPNCMAFEESGGIAVKCMNDVNGNGGTWQKARVFAGDMETSLNTVADIVEDIAGESLCIGERERIREELDER